MALSHTVFPLKGVVQHYSWGGYDFIPQLLGIENRERKPFAEYWLGAHPNHPSQINGIGSFSELIHHQGAICLGDKVYKKFHSLPYLLKVLDVRQMLSIQVHPDKIAAANAFAEENTKGIPLTAPHRNYKDENHKPELMVALSDFWLLHGFKQEEVLMDTLQKVEALHVFIPMFENGRYRALYEHAMKMEQPEVNEILHTHLQEIIPLYEKGALSRSSEDFWAARAALNFCRNGNYDRGIFSIYFFNLLHLRKGEAVFQPAQMPHAYLEGQNVEVMANSDNVLRAGLTDKHIDVAELLKHVEFRATRPNVIGKLEGAGAKNFSTPAEEFELYQYCLEQGQKEDIDVKTAEIMMVVEGEVILNELRVSKGEAVAVFPGSQVSVEAVTGTELFRVTVPGV